MAYPYIKTTYPFPNQQWDLDVRDWGAKGDGSTLDSISIQAALDATESYGGGIVYFPPGSYLIDSAIKLPSKVYIRGVAGTTYYFIDSSPSNFLERENTIIKLIINASSGISMVEPKDPNDFSTAGIENIVLDGNNANQESGSDYYGIKIVDWTTGNQQRSQAQFKNVLIWLAGNYFLGLGDGFVGIDSTAAGRTVTLPILSSMHVGRIFYVTKTDSSDNSVTIVPQGSDTINGGASVSLNGERQMYMIIHAGSAWLGIKVA